MRSPTARSLLVLGILAVLAATSFRAFLPAEKPRVASAPSSSALPTSDLHPAPACFPEPSSAPSDTPAAPEEAPAATFKPAIKRAALLHGGKLLNAADTDTLAALLARSPLDALAWIDREPAGPRRDDLHFAWAALWAKTDFPAAWTWAAAAGNDDLALAMLAGGGATPAAAERGADWIYALPAETEIRSDAFFSVMRESGHLENALVCIESLDTADRERVSQYALGWLAADTPATAYAYALRRTDDSDRLAALMAVVGGWPDQKINELEKLLPSLTDAPVHHLAELRIRSNTP